MVEEEGEGGRGKKCVGGGGSMVLVCTRVRACVSVCVTAVIRRAGHPASRLGARNTRSSQRRAAL